MKKHLFALWIISASIPLISQPAIKWQKSFGGPGIDKCNAVQQTSDGGYIIAGETTSTSGDITVNNGTTDYWVAKIDTAGAIVWQKSLGGSAEDRANGICQAADGGYVVVGTSNSPVSGDVTAPKGLYDFWVVKLNATGAISWQKSMGGTGIDEARSVQQTTDGGYIITGDTKSNNYDVTVNNGDVDFWVVKIDALGAIQWQKSLGGAGTDNAYSVSQTTDGGYIVCGRTNSTNGDVTGNNGGVDYWVVKLSPSGALTWQKCLGGTGTDIAMCVKQTSDGGYIVGGIAGSNNGNVTGNNGLENAWLVKLSSTGTITWQKCFGGNGFEGCHSVQQTADGGYIFTGYASSSSNDVSGVHGSYDYWVVKITSTGTLSWQKCLGGSSSDTGMGIQQTSDQGYVVAGRSASSNGDVTNAKGLDDYWVVRFMGVATPTIPGGIHEMNGGLSQFNVYPNPGKGLITVENKSGLLQYNLVMTDALGRVIFENKNSPAIFTFDVSDKISSGIYFLITRDNNNQFIESKKLQIE